MAISIFIVYLLSLGIQTQVLPFAQGQAQKPVTVINKNPLTATGQFTNKKLQPGETEKLVLQLNLAPQHHSYLEKFKLRQIFPDKKDYTNFIVHPIVIFKDSISSKNKEGVKDLSTLSQQVVIPQANIKNMVFELTYQACTQLYCLLPQKINIDIPVEIKAHKNLFSIFGFKLNLNPDSFQSFLFILALLFAGGLLTSFTPCIFPMIPITLAVLGMRNEGSLLNKFLLSLTYVLGIALIYSILGLAAASTGQLFGSLLGHPAMIIFISSVFVLMALSLFGLFEIQAPAFILNKLGARTQPSGFVGVFTYGLIAGVVASPCVGPVLIGILTYVAHTQDLVLGFIYLFVFATGMGQIFLILGTFSHLTQKLPQSGPWMIRIKYIFAVVMLLMAAYYAQPLFKNKSKNPQTAHDAQLNYTGPVPWQAFHKERLQQALAEGRPVILDFYADWCAACKELDLKTFSQESILQYTKKKNFIWLKYDATETNEAFEVLQKEYNILGLPTVVFYNKKAVWRKDLTLTGFEDEKEFMERLKKLDQ